MVSFGEKLRNTFLRRETSEEVGRRRRKEEKEAELRASSVERQESKRIEPIFSGEFVRGDLQDLKEEVGSLRNKIDRLPREVNKGLEEHKLRSGQIIVGVYCSTRDEKDRLVDDLRIQGKRPRVYRVRRGYIVSEVD